MLAKLLKYDLKYMIKNMSVFYILALFFSILTRILFSIEQTVIINVIGQISVGCMFSMTASILFNTIMRSFVRFNDSLYKDESYLTHTLPVTKKELYESRFLESIIFTIIGILFIIICLFITYYTEYRWILLKNTINSLSIGLNINTTIFIISIIFIFFLEIINLIQNGFLGLIIGHKKNSNKALYSVLFGFITYCVSQGVVLLLIFIIGLFDNGMMSLFSKSLILDSSLLKRIVLYASLIYLIIIFIMNILSYKELEKGVDVE